MSLIRGGGSNYPCNVCIIPSNMQLCLDLSWPWRKAKDAQDIVWDTHLSLGQKDHMLKMMSLRNIEVGLGFVLYDDPVADH